MKKFLLSLSVILSFGLYSYVRQIEVTDDGKLVTPTVTPSIPVLPTNSPQKVTFPESSPRPTAHPTSVPVIPTPKKQGAYNDGEFTGDAVDAYYGFIQVKVVIQNGAIADVLFLQHPNDRRTSVEINSQAMPLLRQEAIQSQSANVDIVSGATDSSQAFRGSLASALSKAK